MESQVKNELQVQRFHDSYGACARALDDGGDYLGAIMYAQDAADFAAKIDPALVRLADHLMVHVRECIDEAWSANMGGEVAPSADLIEADRRAAMLDARNRLATHPHAPQAPAPR